MANANDHDRGSGFHETNMQASKAIYFGRHEKAKMSERLNG